MWDHFKFNCVKVCRNDIGMCVGETIYSSFPHTDECSQELLIVKDRTHLKIA